MFQNLFRYMLMDAAGGNGGDSGSGGGSGSGAGGAGNGAGNSGSSGRGGFLGGTGTGNSGNGTNQQQQATGDNSGAGDPSIKFPENWKLALSKEFQESGALKTISDVPTLVKSYIHAQKLIGADKIPLPSQHATAEEWRNVYLKLGLPADVKDYKIDHAKDGGLSEAFVPQLAAKAHELGILPTQAKALADWMGLENKNALASNSKSQKDALQVEVGKLKSEWGAAFAQKLAEAQSALSHFADKETIEHMEKTGLVNDIKLVKLFAKVSEVLKEDGIIKEAGAGSGAMTPAAARQASDVIIRDMNHPYYHKDHPGHAAAVREVTGLFAMQSASRK